MIKDIDASCFGVSGVAFRRVRQGSKSGDGRRGADSGEGGGRASAKRYPVKAVCSGA